MKNNFMVLIAALTVITSCNFDQGKEPALLVESDPEPENVAPVVSIDYSGGVIPNGQSVTLTASVDDPDSQYFGYFWNVDGVEAGENEELIFSRSPEVETLYSISLTVSDGEGEGSDSITLTVLKKPWTPEVWHIYFLLNRVEASEAAICKEYVASSNSDYDRMWSASSTTLELWNRDHPDQQCYRLGGGTI